LRQILFLILFLLLALASALAIAISFIELPDATVRMATGDPNGAYAKLARTWKQELARFGVNLELTEDEGIKARGALLERKAEAGFLVGGLSTSFKYFSYGEKNVITDEDDLRSIGRMFDEPIWVYYRRPDAPIEGLQAFKGKRISVGTKGSGRSSIISMLLHANGITPETEVAVFSYDDFPSDAKPLIEAATSPDAVDVAFLILPSDNQTVKDLLGNPNDILLMTFADLAGAYIGKFPFLSKVVMDKGAFQLDPRIIPTAEITLLNTAPALVVHKNLHPVLVTLLTHATVVKPKSSVDPATGYPVMFFKAGKYPHINDPEYDVHEAATAYHKSGELPLVLQNLGRFNARYGIPFWVTAIVAQHGTKIVLLAIPIFTVLIPFSRIIPTIYAWSIRRRLLRWYDRLKAVEATLDRTEATPTQLSLATEELEQIDRAVSTLRIPRPFSNQLYELRSYVNLVQQRLSTRTGRGA
jgi:TRAP-type uncharacterized transport system substrate-binding protein